MDQLHAAAWTPSLRDLWHRIESHDLEPDSPLNFTRRLARDKKWRLDFTRSAIREYRRFCFLAAAASHPVTPSEAVDEVWHTHLTYSRDYWDVWCKQVLRRPLHHDPTQGKEDEQRYFRAQYAETLALYETYFGPPDPGFWPATHIRFGRPRSWRIGVERALLILRSTAGWRRVTGTVGGQ